MEGVRHALIAIVVVAGCGEPRARQPLYAAGTEKDEGHGLLAHASSTLLTSDVPDPTPFPATTGRRADDDGGGAAYGGARYAGYTAPSWSYPSANRAAHYTTVAGLTGVVAGIVTTRSPTASPACGADDAPRGGNATHAVAGALVFIEHVATGRVLAQEGGERRPATVGGVVAKHGCALVPTVQLVAPLPAALSIHGDATPTKLRITTATGTAATYDLDAGGRVAMQVRPGVTRVEAEDGSLVPAWIVALDTPAYAVTDDAGRFRIEELAAGTYDVTIWLPPVVVMKDGRFGYGEPRITHRSVSVSSARPARLDVMLGR